MHKLKSFVDNKAVEACQKKGVGFLWIKYPGETPDGFPDFHCSGDGTGRNLAVKPAISALIKSRFLFILSAFCDRIFLSCPKKAWVEAPLFQHTPDAVEDAGDTG